MDFDTKKKILIGGSVGLVAVVVIAVLFFNQSDSPKGVTEEVINQEVSTSEPIDIVTDFYDEWLVAVRATSTNPYQLGLPARPILSKGLSARLKETEVREAGSVDPVLCQTTVPEKITTRTVFEVAGKTQILVMSKDKAIYEQAIITLLRHNDGWYIDDISCSPGEFAPVREFTFDKEGFLLKSVPPPLNPEFWHIVFEESGELGHFSPLLFDAETKCIATDKTETVCSPDQFVDATKVHVYGQMIESGVEVTRLEFIEE